MEKIEKIVISDKKKFKKIIENIKNDGFWKLHILSDFDRTLTKEFVNWEKRPSLISTLRINNILWDEYSKKAYELFDFYNPIEINNNLDFVYKKQQMSIWWEKHLELLVKSWLKKSDIDIAINSWILELRNWVWKFLNFLNEKNIPVIIISANALWTDSNRMFLKNNNLYFENIKIISNELIWDKNWIAIWYEKPVIHVFNKDETILKDFSEIYEKIKLRKNVILLWDSLWDPKMIDWFDYNNLLKIGFLNDKIDELLEEYKKNYDVLIIWDGDFSFINEILDIK